MQITRLVEMIYILLRRKTVTAAELAEQFGISVRTVYRDVDALSLSGILYRKRQGRRHKPAS